MLERDRIALRRYREECAAAETARLREVEAALQKSANALAKEQKMEVARGEDSQVFVCEATLHSRMSVDDAQRFNGESARTFVRKHPEYLANDYNCAQILNYFERNRIEIISCETLEAAYKRLSDHGLLQEKPTPSPPPASRPRNTQPQKQAPSPPKPEVYEG